MMQNSIRRCPSLERALLVLVANGFALGACGGPSEPARSPSSQQETQSESGAAHASDDADTDDTAPTQPSQPEPTDEAPPAVAAEAESPDAPAAEAEPASETRKGKPTSKPATETDAAAQLASELEKRRKAAKAQTPEADDEEESSAAPAEPVASGYNGPDPCRATSFSLDRVKEACSSGGRAAAKRVMKDAITKAIATSQRFVCADCHSNQKDYTLKPNAVAELKRLLES